MQDVPAQLEPDDIGLTTPSGDLVRDIESLLLTFAQFSVFPSHEELPILIGPGWENVLKECTDAGYIEEIAAGGLALTKSGERAASELAADHARSVLKKGVEDDGKESIEEGGEESGQVGTKGLGAQRAPAREGPKVCKDRGRNRAKGQRRHRPRRSQ